MPELGKLSKTVNMPHREVKKVSNHIFSGSRNHFLTLDIMSDDKPFIGTTGASAIRLNFSNGQWVDTTPGLAVINPPVYDTG